MSFPPPPLRDFQVSSLYYTARLPQPQFTAGTGASMDFGAGVSTSLLWDQQQTTMGVSFTFTPAGSFGSFNQATAEAAFAAAVTAVLTVMASMSGLTLGSLQALVIVARTVGWTSLSAGVQYNVQDTMTYPVPALGFETAAGTDSSAPVVLGGVAGDAVAATEFNWTSAAVPDRETVAGTDGGETIT
jgi:hypothetical protein